MNIINDYKNKIKLSVTFLWLLITTSNISERLVNNFLDESFYYYSTGTLPKLIHTLKLY